MLDLCTDCGAQALDVVNTTRVLESPGSRLIPRTMSARNASGS